MWDVFGILLMFMGAATGLDPVICRFTGSDQCYVALGQRLHLEIPLNSEDGFNLQITNSINISSFIIKYRKSQSKPPTPSPPRWQFVNDNKTMILTSAERSDSGTYTLEIVGVNGNIKRSYSLQLNTEGSQEYTLAILSTIAVLLIVLALLAFYIYKTRQGLRNKEASAQDGKELVYDQATNLPTKRTDTRPEPAQDKIIEYATVAKSPGPRNQKKKEDEVHYGEIVFNTPAAGKSKKPKAQEECVYSQVQHGQSGTRSLP